MATFFKGQMKRRPDKVSRTLGCPLKKGHGQIGSESERSLRKREQFLSTD